MEVEGGGGLERAGWPEPATMVSGEQPPHVAVLEALMNDVIAEYRRGVLYLDAGDPIEAAKILAAVLDEEPGNAEVRLWLARAYFKSAQLNRAESHLRALVDRDPTDHYPCHLLGRTLGR